MYKKIVTLIILATLLVSPGLVFAFGLGEIEIHSALNQPMDAEIELVGFKVDEIDEVKVNLANQQMFERVGVPRPYILTRLKFTPSVSAGSPVIKVTSTDPIREPFLTFLIDVRWAKGKLLREYTVLLDPPVFGDQAKAAIQAPKVTRQAAPKAKPTPKVPPKAKSPTPKVASPNVAQTPKPTPSPVSRPPTPLKKTESSVSVNRGDTLWSIAEPLARQSGVSVNQMMLAIQAANPQGFGQGNINNLKSGVVLRIPAEGLDRYSSREALAEVQRQWQVWQQGRQLAETTDNVVNVDASDTAKSEAPPSEEPSSKQEPVEKTDSSKLSILGDDDVTDGKSGDDAQAVLSDLRNQVNLLKESSESKGQENSELKDRIQSLESMIKKQEDIISLQNEQLAQLQNTLSTDVEASITPEAQSATPEESVVEEVSSETEAVIEAQPEAVSVISTAKVEPLPDFTDPIPEEFLNADQAEAQPESLAAEAEVASEAEQTVIEEPESIVAAPSFMDSVIDVLREQGRSLLYAGLALLAGLLGWSWLKRRRSRGDESAIAASGLPAFEEEPSIDEMLDETVVATPDSVDQALDDLEEVDSDLEAGSETDADQEEADSDDVLAEADVYISYGLYQQAEELLKEGLAKEPSNQQYQLKLAEIYYSDKKPDEFAQHVEAMEPNFNKDSAEWSKVASMGAALIPAHALFAGVSEGAEAVTASDEIPESSTASDFDIDDDDDIEAFSEELDDNSLDFTFGDSEEIEANDSGTVIEEVPNFDSSEVDDELEESSTAVLESDMDFSTDDATQAFAVDDALLGNAEQSDTNEEASSEDEVFLDFDQDALESELGSDTTHDSETEMLDQSASSETIDLDDAIDLDIDSETESVEAPANNLDNDFDEMLEGDNSETAMFDSSLFDVGSSETESFEEPGQERVDEDTVSLEQVQENLTAELETLSFDGDVDPDKIEEESLPTLQTAELGRPDMDGIDDLDDNLAASETGTFEADVLADNVTEQFDVGNIDSTMTDLGEFGDDMDLETPSVIEEVGTKLDLAKAFVDMGDEDAAKETLTEVIEQGDLTQIQEAKDLLDKLN